MRTLGVTDVRTKKNEISRPFYYMACSKNEFSRPFLLWPFHPKNVHSLCSFCVPSVGSKKVSSRPFSLLLFGDMKLLHLIPTMMKYWAILLRTDGIVKLLIESISSHPLISANIKFRVLMLVNGQFWPPISPPSAKFRKYTYIWRFCDVGYLKHL